MNKRKSKLATAGKPSPRFDGSPADCSCGGEAHVFCHDSFENVRLGKPPTYWMECEDCGKCGPSSATEGGAVMEWNKQANMKAEADR